MTIKGIWKDRKHLSNVVMSYLTRKTCSHTTKVNRVNNYKSKTTSQYCLKSTWFIKISYEFHWALSINTSSPGMKPLTAPSVILNTALLSTEGFYVLWKTALGYSKA